MELSDADVIQRDLRGYMNQAIRAINLITADTQSFPGLLIPLSLKRGEKSPLKLSTLLECAPAVVPCWAVLALA